MNNYYRCERRDKSPGTGADAFDAGHKKSLHVPEIVLTAAVNGWLAGLFAPENRDATVHALVGCQEPDQEPPAVEAVRRRLADADTRLGRFRKAIAQGVDASAVAAEINQAQSDANTARAELAYLQNTAPANLIDATEIHATLDSLGDIAAVLDDARPDHTAALYASLGLQVRVRETPDGTREAAVSVDIASVRHGAPCPTCVARQYGVRRRRDWSVDDVTARRHGLASRPGVVTTRTYRSDRAAGRATQDGQCSGSWPTAVAPVVVISPVQSQVPHQQ